MKFIVYCTTNIVNKKIYIGVHKTENPDKFDGYLGCSVRATQPSTYMNPKTAFQYAVKKYGTDKFSRSILYVYDTAEEAFNKEKELVKYVDVVFLGWVLGDLKSKFEHDVW